jgi:hypothetical protein
MKHFHSIAAVILATAICACSSQIVNVPISPYVDMNFKQRHVRRVAVLPFIIPEYLSYREGAEAASIEITNRFIESLAAAGIYQIADGDAVKESVKHTFANPRDWIIQGTRTEAVRIGRELEADAVIYGVVKKYFQGNLSDSEVEMEVDCVEITSMLTVWRVREILIGKGGSKYLNESGLSIPPARLSEIAADDTVQKVRRINELGGPIDVVSISNRKAWGYGVMASGIALTGTSAYFYYQSQAAYHDYKNATNSVDLDRNQKKVETYDQYWQFLGGAGVLAVGTGLYLILTDHSVETRTGTLSLPYAHAEATLQPAVYGPGTPGILCAFSFR